MGIVTQLVTRGGQRPQLAEVWGSGRGRRPDYSLPRWACLGIFVRQTSRVADEPRWLSKAAVDLDERPVSVAVAVTTDRVSQPSRVGGLAELGY